MSEENPYAPPESHAVDDGPRLIQMPERMPAPVIVATILIGLILVNLLLGVYLSSAEGEVSQPFVPIAITLAVLLGILMRHPTAWSVSRSLAVLGSFLLGLAVVFGLLAGDGGARLTLALVLLPSLGMNVAIFLLMSRPTARAWFGLACPTCGHLHPHPVKWGYRLARCRDCHALWDPKTGQLKAQ